jgi:hypothetical protein
MPFLRIDSRSAIVRCGDWEGVARVRPLQFAVEHRRAAVAYGVRVQRLRAEAAVRVTGARTRSDKGEVRNGPSRCSLLHVLISGLHAVRVAARSVESCGLTWTSDVTGRGVGL